MPECGKNINLILKLIFYTPGATLTVLSLHFSYTNHKGLVVLNDNSKIFWTKLRLFTANLQHYHKLYSTCTSHIIAHLACKIFPHGNEGIKCTLIRMVE